MATSSTIAIDIGTCYSRVGVYQKGKVQVIVNEHGNTETPSYVAFTQQGLLVGEQAKKHSEIDPENTIFDLLYLLGKRNDEFLDLDLRRWPFKIVFKNGHLKVKVFYKGEDRVLEPEFILALLLKKMRKIAESYLGKECQDVLLTIPDGFRDCHKRAFKDACEIAGLNLLRMINVSTAAAITYYMEKRPDEDQDILICYLGGGTASASLVTVGSGYIHLAALGGHVHPGGRYIDDNLTEEILETLWKKYRIDLRPDKVAVSRVRNACEDAKATLSAEVQALLYFPGIYENRDFYESLPPSQLPAEVQRMSHWISTSARRVVEQRKDLFRDFKLLMVGGLSKCTTSKQVLGPACQSLREIYMKTTPEDAVVFGAAVLAAGTIPGLPDIYITETLPYNIGFETAGYKVIDVLQRSHPFPCTRKSVLKPSADNQGTVYLNLYEGHSRRISCSNLLCTVELTGFSTKSKQMPFLEMVYAIDDNGILDITATEVQTGKQLKVEENRRRLNKDDMKRLKDEAKKYWDSTAK